MKLETEIKRLQELIRIQKQFVHEPRDGKPVPRDVAKMWQVQLRGSKGRLKELQALSGERKRQRRQQGR